ncbi:MAG: hypothetical protein AAB393_16970, partial [Bacteroidota bacterium]
MPTSTNCYDCEVEPGARRHVQLQVPEAIQQDPWYGRNYGPTGNKQNRTPAEKEVDDAERRAFQHAYGYTHYLEDAGIPLGDQNPELGCPADKGGSAFVHDVYGIPIQDFVKDAKGAPRFPGAKIDGHTALAYNNNVKLDDNTVVQRAFLLRGAFWGAYKCLKPSYGDAMGGAELLGAPTENEHPDKIDDHCNHDEAGTAVSAVQRFDNGCMWWQGGKVHVHRKGKDTIPEERAEGCNIEIVPNPPGPSKCTDECSPGQSMCVLSNHVLICGNLDDDTCLDWLELACSKGTVCKNGSCVTCGHQGEPCCHVASCS